MDTNQIIEDLITMEHHYVQVFLKEKKECSKEIAALLDAEVVDDLTATIFTELRWEHNLATFKAHRSMLETCTLMNQLSTGMDEERILVERESRDSYYYLQLNAYLKAKENKDSRGFNELSRYISAIGIY